MNGDLISRAALIKEIEHGKHPEFYDGQDIADWQMQCIENAPAVDAVPVVRCCDCVIHGNCQTEQVFKFCGKHDGFCCVGKRLSNEVE